MPAPSRSTKPRFEAFAAIVLAAFAGLVAGVALIRGVPAWAGWLYASASVLCFVLYGVDKAAARGQRDRIPESTLLALGVVGGWPGALVAQQVFRHKTAKRSFRGRFWVSVVVNVGVFVWLATRAR